MENRMEEVSKFGINAYVVIPTYNEAENISRIIPEVLDRDPGISVLVVDDNSPDGTANLVKELPQFGERVFILERPGKAGLGAAYRAGFKWVLENTEAECIFEMDADFSHDPSAIDEFLTEIKDYDVVLGSRYLHGITVVNWPLSRVILSVGANMYARLITGIKIKDSTGGFKCFRRKVLEAMPLDKIRSEGYSFQIEMNVHCWRRGFSMKEIPIMFVDRQVGVSKMSKRIIWEAIWMVWVLRFKRIAGRKVS
jgi:dolichol-phosphate mannosyltransferase